MFDAPAICWQKGDLVYQAEEITPRFGNRNTVTSGTAWTVTRDGNKTVDQTGAYTIAGENGKSHDGIYVQAQKPGLWPSMSLIQGFSFRWSQNSTAGHGLFMRNCGISIVRRDGYGRQYWGSDTYSRNNTYDWQTTRWNFSADDRDAMKDYYFEGLWVRASSDGGTGTRATELKVGDFRLYYSAGSPSGLRRWVVGKYVTRLYFGNEIIAPRID